MKTEKPFYVDFTRPRQQIQWWLLCLELLQNISSDRSLLTTPPPLPPVLLLLLLLALVMKEKAGTYVSLLQQQIYI